MNIEKIKQLCEMKGISINTLESESGIGRGNIGRWEKYTPGVDKVKAVADYFGVTIDYLLNEEKPYDEKEEILEKAFTEKPDMRILFKVSEKCSPAEIKTAIRLIQALRGDTEYEDI